MKRTQIVSLTKKQGVVVIEVIKKEDALEAIHKALSLIGFDRLSANKLWTPLGDSDDNFSARSYRPGLYEDRHFIWSNRRFVAQIFCGKHRCFFSILSLRGQISAGLGKKVLETFDK